MATITVSQSGSVESSLAAGKANHDSCRDEGNRVNRLQGNIPSPPVELYGIVDTTAANGRTKQRFGNRNPYLPILARKKEMSRTELGHPVEVPKNNPHDLETLPPSAKPETQRPVSTKLLISRDGVDVSANEWQIPESLLPASLTVQNPPLALSSKYPPASKTSAASGATTQEAPEATNDSTAENEGGAGHGTNTLLRPTMTLPANAAPRDNERVIVRNGERSSIDVVSEVPELSNEGGQQEAEVEALYQARLDKRRADEGHEQVELPSVLSSPISTTRTSRVSVGSSSRDTNGTSEISSISNFSMPSGLRAKFSLAGFKKEQYTSAPLQTEIKLAPSMVSEPLARYTVTKFDKKLYVCTDMPKPAEISRLWDENYRQLLREALQRSATARDDNESALALEFYMASTNLKNFKPSILLTCCSSKQKKALKSTLGDLRWLKESGLQYFIRVDKSFGYRAYILRAPTGEVLPEIEARLLHAPTTLCGTSARIAPSRSSIPGKSAIRGEVRFTIGGLLCIDGHYGYLTAGHPFALPPPRLQPSESVSQASESEESDSDSSISPSTSPSSYEELDMQLAASGEQWEVSHERHQANALILGTDSATPYRIIPHKGLMSNVTSPSINLKLESNVFREFTFDWAFVLASPTLLLPNLISIPGEESPTPIEDFVPIIDLVSGPVYVMAGSGLYLATLDATPVTLFLGGRFHDVRRITLCYCLEHGDSGSWVISDGRLCGFIIAGRDSIPWAYMVCIDDVFGDIRSCFEGEAWVHLPSISEPNAERNTKVIEQPFSQPAEDSGIVSIRKPGFSPPQDSSATQNEKRNSAPRFAKVHVKAKKGGLRFWILIFALVLSMFLDDLGIATSIPRITDHFESLNDVGWYASSFLLSKAVCYTPFRSLYAHFLKRVFLVSVLILEIGYLICAVSTSSTMFIIGRSISGIGSSGVSTGAVLIGFAAVAQSGRKNSPIVWGLMGLASQLSLVSRPIIFGALVDKVTWRWTFYIDMPIAATVLMLVLICFRTPQVPAKTWTYTLTLLGTSALQTAPFISLLLSLNWAGRKYAFKDTKVVVLFVLPIMLAASLWALRLQTKKLSSILTQYLFWWPKLSSTTFPILFGALMSSGCSVMRYYLSIWFQAIKGVSALDSSYMSLALTIGIFAASFVGGIAIPSSISKYHLDHALYMLVASILSATGAGLMGLFTDTSPKSIWISFQVLLGIGAGIGLQMPSHVIAATLQDKSELDAYLTLAFAHALSGSVFHSIAHSIFVNTLRSGLGVDRKVLLHTGLTTFLSAFPEDEHVLALRAYNRALVNVFYLGAAILAFSIIGAVFSFGRKVKEDDSPRPSQRGTSSKTLLGTLKTRYAG